MLLRSNGENGHIRLPANNIWELTHHLSHEKSLKRWFSELPRTGNGVWFPFQVDQQAYDELGVPFSDAFGTALWTHNEKKEVMISESKSYFVDIIIVWRDMAAAAGIVFPIVPTHHQYVNLLCRVHLVNIIAPGLLVMTYEKIPASSSSVLLVFNVNTLPMFWLW